MSDNGPSRAIVWRTTPAAVAALAFSLVAGLGCGQAPATGDVALIVSVPDGVTLTRVAYVIARSGVAPLAGSFESPPSMSTFTHLVTHVPTGRGYSVQVNAATTDGLITCEATGEAEVERHATTRVNLPLVCRDARDGHVSVVVKIECPSFEVTAFSVSPLSASIGGAIDVSATTSSIDGGVPSFAWTASAGGFAAPTMAHTTYTCTSPGMVDLRVTASFDVCVATKDVTVSCGSDASASP